MDARVVTLLRRHPMFACLSADETDQLCADAAIVRVHAGEPLYSQGEEARTMFLVVTGALSLQDSWCPEDAIGPIGAGELVGAEALVAGAPRAYSALAVGEVEAWPIPALAFCRRLDGNFDRALNMIAALSARLRTRVKQIAEYKLQSTYERLAGYLADMAEVEEGPVILRLPFEKRTLADRLGMDPATLSRAFAKLRPLGVQADRKDRISIADVARLRELAMPDGGLMGEID